MPCHHERVTLQSWGSDLRNKRPSPHLHPSQPPSPNPALKTSLGTPAHTPRHPNKTPHAFSTPKAVLGPTKKAMDPLGQSPGSPKNGFRGHQARPPGTGPSAHGFRRPGTPLTHENIRFPQNQSRSSQVRRSRATKASRALDPPKSPRLRPRLRRNRPSAMASARCRQKRAVRPRLRWIHGITHIARLSRKPGAPGGAKNAKKAFAPPKKPLAAPRTGLGRSKAANSPLGPKLAAPHARTACPLRAGVARPGPVPARRKAWEPLL